MSKAQTKAIKPNSEQAGEPSKSSRPVFFRLTIDEQMLFAKRLAMLLKAGVPIMEAMRMLVRQAKSRSARHVFGRFFSDMEQGRALHESMSDYERQFGSFAVNLVKIGEITGTLHDNLEYLAEGLKKRRELRRKVLGALFYPAFIVVATLGITVMLVVYVFPKILPILSGFKGDLPFATRMLIWVSTVVTTQGGYIAVAVFVLIVSGIMLMRLAGVRRIVHELLLRTPFLGSMVVYYNMSNFCRTMGILLKSETGIVQATEVTAGTLANLAYRQGVFSIAERLGKGEKFSELFEQYPALFPVMVAEIIQVGESSGNLGDSFTYLADIYEGEVEELTKNLSATIEPALMVFMGLLIGFIAISIITPIYQITQNLTIK